MKRSLIFTLLSASLLLSGCGAVGLAAGAGAIVGTTASREGGLQAGVNDASIKAQINDLWFKHDMKMFSKLSMTIDQGRVLLTGVVQNPEHRVEAVRLAWQPKGVKQVINEIRVGESSSWGTIARDEWINAELKTRLIANKGVQSINYNIETVQGSVYLMGVARNQDELDRVIRVARGIKGVKEVISYVKLSGEPISSAGASTSVSGSRYATQPGTPVPVTPATTYDTSVDQTTYPSAPVSNAPASVESEVLPP